MRTYLVLLSLLLTGNLLFAQRNQQPANTGVARNAPLSTRVSYSTSNRDSLRVELINVDVPGLEIVSCEHCTVFAPWILKNGGTLDVVVKNRGATRSNTATVWLEYNIYKFKSYKIEKVLASDRKGVPALDPGQTTKLTFNIVYSAPDKVYNQQMKGVRVSLTQNGGRAWRETE